MFSLRHLARFCFAGLRRWWRPGRWVGLALVSCLLGLWLSPALAHGPAGNRPGIEMIDLTAQATLPQGQHLYEAGRYLEAISVLEQVANTTSDSAEAVLALRNLALVHRQLGQWQAAEQAIQRGSQRLPEVALGEASLAASLLEVQGSLALDQGQAEAAIGYWQEAAQRYTDLGQPRAASQAQINQAQARQQLGFHRSVVMALEPIVLAMADQPPSLNQAVALRTLGDSLVQVGSLTAAETALTQSLAIAQVLPNPAAVGAAALSLGNLTLVQGDITAAEAYLAQATAADVPLSTQMQAHLSRLQQAVQTRQVAQAQALWPTVLTSLDALPPSQPHRLARIALAQTLIDLGVAQNPTPRQIADMLAVAVQTSREARDGRTESFALGTLGHLYETQGQWQEAQALTQEAQAQAQGIDAKDSLYRWEGQLGRIFKAQGKADQAISAYSHAVNTLQRLRTDLVAVNSTLQFSFQDTIEPIHRDLVSLLLDPSRDSSPQDLETARQTMESLQLAELDNFFREACLNAAAVDIDQLDQRAAILYPIILADRLEIIVSLPQQPLSHYSSPVVAAQLSQTIEQLQQALVLRVGRQHLAPAQQLYDWMIDPIAATLATTEVDTLVFVLDGQLRNIPMAVLYDGQQFLIEKYNLALTPGLQLVDPKPLKPQTLRVLTAGLSESRQGFSSLPNVVSEVEEIQSIVPTTLLLNDAFTVDSFEGRMEVESVPIIHMATHGKFSSSNEETFVLTWDDRLNITGLNNLLQVAELNQDGPVELLVLSACQTATGDRQAALGMAGMAVRSGARSTIATLWQVNDEATAILMSDLYRQLATRTHTKAEALRHAQLTVLREPKFREHPFFWAPYVLLGNWL